MISIKIVFIGSTIADMMEMDKNFEDEANSFASNLLIPKAAMKRFAPDRFTSDEEIKAFAGSIGIHILALLPDVCNMIRLLRITAAQS